MQDSYPRLIGWAATTLTTLLFLSLPTYGQDHLAPHSIPQLKPLVRLVGFVNTTLAPTNVRPVVTFKLPGDEKRYTFLIIEMKVMAGPLRTTESILAEVKPYTPNFRIRTSREITTQIAAAQPTERLTILAEYSSSDRALLIQSLENSEDGKRKE